jgi:CheY-like chemotaxis protein
VPAGHNQEASVTLPASAANTIGNTPAVAATVRRGVRILVVDDSIDAAESLMSLLRVWGHDVQMVHDGPAALEVAAAFVPTIVFLDIGMPGMDGYEVARRVRRVPALERAWLVAQTGFGSEQDRRRAQEAGFDRHLTKPVDPADLRMVIASAPDMTDAAGS